MMVAPVAVMPVMAVPAMMVPMPVVIPVMVMPAHLYRLDLIDFVLRHDRRLNIRRCCHGSLGRNRRYGRSLRACAKQDRARDQSSTEFQEISEFHEFTPLFS
jgi:hypothetical protein